MTKIRRVLLFGVIAPVALQTQLVAQTAPDTFRLKEVVVTAMKVAVPRSATTATMTILSGDSLRQRGLRTVAEALRQTPSAAVVQSGSQGALTSLFLRGGESDYVQVLIDGVRVNQPGGVYDWSNLTLDNVERIEIVRGPVSVLYGSDAVTGVVQIFTRAGTAPQLRLRVGGGMGARAVPDSLRERSYGTRTLSAELGGRAGALSYTTGIGHSGSDGLYAFNNGYANTTASLRSDLALSRGSTLSWTARYMRSEFHYPTDGNGNLVDRNQFRRNEAFTTGLDWSVRVRQNVRVGVRGGVNHNLDRNIDDPDGPADTLGTFTSQSRNRLRRSFVEASTHFQPHDGTVFSLGAELEQQEDVNRYDSDGVFGPFSSRFGKDRTNRSVYGQAVHAWDRFTLNAGLRVDANDRFGDFLTYRAGAALQPWSRTRLRVAGGTAFKEPTFFENYAEGFTRGNPALEPEHSRSVEFGLEQTLPGTLGVVQVTHFRQRFRDLIQYVSRAFGSTEPNYQNITAANALGTELEWSLTALPNIGITGSVTRLETRALEADVEDPAFEPGAQLLRRPEWLANIAASYTRGNVSLESRWYYVGERADLSFASFPAERVTLDAYNKLDLTATLHTRALGSSPLLLTLRLENLFDRKYQEILNYAARGRSLWLGLETTLGW
ncbi:MAG: TonB-dependent receptor plug domain-containing protein [Longimicrobiales bacterium]